MTPRSLFAAVAVLLTGCAGETVETATAIVSEALASASDTADAPESANMMRGLKGVFRSEAAEGFRCDSTPDITYVDVCGQQLPQTVNLAWTDCAPPERHRHGEGDGGCVGGDGGHPPRLPPDGGLPPPRDGRRGPGPSSGTAQLSYTYATPDGCTGAIVQSQSATYSITREGPDGSSATVAGTSSSVAELVVGAPPQVKQTQLDVTRTRTDAAGAVVRSTHVTGSMTVSFSDADPPTRTANGSFTEESSDGTSGTTTLTDVVRPPHDVCAWPTSGTMVRALADGTSHTLVYGPNCGDATLDGAVIDLSVRPERGEGGSGGGMRPPPPGR